METVHIKIKGEKGGPEVIVGNRQCVPGEVVEVPRARGRKLIAAGVAEEAKAPPERRSGVETATTRQGGGTR